MGRNKPNPTPALPFWKKEGKMFRCDGEELKQAFKATGLGEEHLKRRLGWGVDKWEKALRGEPLTGYEAQFVELALVPHEGPVMMDFAHLVRGFQNKKLF